MQTLFNIFGFIVLLVIIGLLMYFIIYVEKFENDIREDVVNDDMLSQTVLLDDNETNDNDYSILNKNKTHNSIKYTEGITWNNWVNVNRKEVLKDIEGHVRNYIDNFHFDAQLILCRLNRYRHGITDQDTVLLDYDIVLYNAKKKYADHCKLLCVYHIKNGIDVVHFNIIGKIHEDQIYMKSNNDIFDAEYKSYKQQHIYKDDFLNNEDDYKSLKTHDEQVDKLMYNKLMGNNSLYNDDKDYIKNREHQKAHDIVRNMFMDGLKTPSINIDKTPHYKSYPYKNDFIISCI